MVNKYFAFDTGSTMPLTIAQALELAKSSREIPNAARQLLEQTRNNAWAKITQHPDTYIMTRDEFAVINYYSAHFKDDQNFKQAVARFWKNYHGNPASEDGSSQSVRGKTPPEGPQRKTSVHGENHQSRTDRAAEAGREAAAVDTSQKLQDTNSVGRWTEQFKDFTSKDPPKQAPYQQINENYFYVLDYLNYVRPKQSYSTCYTNV